MEVTRIAWNAVTKEIMVWTTFCSFGQVVYAPEVLPLLLLMGHGLMGDVPVVFIPSGAVVYAWHAPWLNVESRNVSVL